MSSGVRTATYKVVNMTSEAAHGVFDGPACASATIRAHMRRLIDAQYGDASMAVCPRKVRPLFGNPDIYPPRMGFT